MVMEPAEEPSPPPPPPLKSQLSTPPIIYFLLQDNWRCWLQVIHNSVNLCWVRGTLRSESEALVVMGRIKSMKSVHLSCIMFFMKS